MASAAVRRQWQAGNSPIRKVGRSALVAGAYRHRQQTTRQRPDEVCMGRHPRQRMLRAACASPGQQLQAHVLIFGGGRPGPGATIFIMPRSARADEVAARSRPRRGKWEAIRCRGINRLQHQLLYVQGGCRHRGADATERFSAPRDVLEYEVTIDDPRTYTRPWTAAWTLRWTPGDIQEEFCETNRP